MKPFLCIPSWDGNITCDTFSSLWGVIQGAVLHDALLHVQNHDVVRVRNRAAYEFLQSDCSHLWFVDADVGFTVDVPKALMASGRDLVAAIYPKKTIRWGQPRESVLEWPFSPLDEGSGFMSQGAATFQRAEYLPMGCAILSRAVVEDVSEKADRYVHQFERGGPIHQVPNIFGQLLHDTPKGRMLLPEDFSFTVRAREAGYDAWAMVDPVCTHTGSFRFNAREIGT